MIQEGKTKLDAQREYNRRYYRKNRKKISDRRKAAYHTNPAKRRQIRRDSLNSYHRRRNKDNNRVNYSVKEVEGVPLYSIQYASAVTGKSTDLIRQWEKEKIIPLSTYVDSRGWRLYTGHQLNIMSKGFRDLATGELTKITLSTYLRNGWEVETEEEVDEN